MRSLRTLWTFASVGVALLVVVAVAGATPQAASPPVEVSTTNPFAACPPDGAGINFPGSEVEPWIDVNPTNSANRIAVYQQDRYSNGGSKGTVAAATFNGGATWTQVAIPTETRCTGGPFQRASDPWVTFGPDGTAHSMSLATDRTCRPAAWENGMVYSRSTDGGLTWEDPILLVTEDDPRFLHDKNSMTADPNDADFVYAGPGASVRGFDPEPGERDRSGLQGPIYFTRTTNGGDTWEPARKIYETGANKQTIGNQIVVRPQGQLFDFFTDVVNGSNRRGGIGPTLLSYIVSADRGETWSHPVSIDDQLPMALFRQSSTVDLEPASARTRPRPEPVRSAAATSSRMWRSTRRTGSCTPCGGRPLQLPPDRRLPVGQHRVQPVDRRRADVVAGHPGQRDSAGEQSELPGVHAFGRGRK